MASFLQERWVGDWINSRITNGEAELCFDVFALKNIIVKVTRGQLSRCLGVFVFRLNHGILVGMDSVNGKQNNSGHSKNRYGKENIYHCHLAAQKQ